MKYRLIEDDLYHIADRIKYINPFYIVKFNLKKRIFEVHDKRFRTASLCFVVGDRLNATALKKAVDTQPKFSKKIFSSIRDNNKRLNQKNDEYLRDFASVKLRAYIDYVDSHPSSDISFDVSNKTKWI